MLCLPLQSEKRDTAQESEVTLSGPVLGPLGYAVSVRLFDVATAFLPATSTECTCATQLAAGAEPSTVNAAE